MARNRIRYRQRQREKKEEERRLYGSLDRNNAFGKRDLTPYNAVRVINKIITTEEIKF